MKNSRVLDELAYRVIANRDDADYLAAPLSWVKVRSYGNGFEVEVRGFCRYFGPAPTGIPGGHYQSGDGLRRWAQERWAGMTGARRAYAARNGRRSVLPWVAA